MTEIKNIQFTNLIKSGGRLREFNFRKSQGVSGSIFTVDVADASGNRHYIIYQLQDNLWTLQSRHEAPWIREALPNIQEAIEPYR